MTTSPSPLFWRGNGRLWVRNYAAPAAPLVRLANVQSLKILIQEKTDTLQDYDNPSGGIAAMSSRIVGAEVAFVIHDLNPDNMARFLWGSAATRSGNHVTAELHVAYHGALVELDQVGATAVVVKSADDTTTFTAGDDYQLHGAGLYIPPTSSIADGASIHVAYTYPTQYQVDAMLGAGYELTLLFDGLNLARDGSLKKVNCWRVKCAPPRELFVKDDRFGTLTITGQLLADTTRPTGQSQYFTETSVF
ncbi:MAG: hypothetical protein HQL66_12675 [Magnetococcales bacterium]|nr:hypothetical protein [Magnetococcales bacterium]